MDRLKTMTSAPQRLGSGVGQTVFDGGQDWCALRGHGSCELDEQGNPAAAGNTTSYTMPIRPGRLGLRSAPTE
jgi:hypothetical protein